MKYLLTILVFFTLFLACKKAALYKDDITTLQTPVISNTTEDFWVDATSSATNEVVFIAGFDEDDNTYYANAAKHFNDKNIPVIHGLNAISQIIAYLNTSSITYHKVHIVSHSNAWRGMALLTTAKGQRITATVLQESLATGAFPLLKTTKVPQAVIFHSCGLGAHKQLVSLLKASFTNQKAPTVFASSYFNIFGGKFSSHYLAQPYYVFYPTAQSPGPLALSKEIATTYPSQQQDWLTHLKTREETTLGNPYSYKFNIPLVWEVAFNNKEEIPVLKDKEAIMDFIITQDALARELFKLSIPIEKFRWSTYVQQNKLVIKGKTTALCVLAPVMQAQKKLAYATPQITNPDLYVQL